MPNAPMLVKSTSQTNLPALAFGANAAACESALDKLPATEPPFAATTNTSTQTPPSMMLPWIKSASTAPK